jgi:hypothetical protein
MPLGALLCTLGVKCTPPPMRAHPLLCVHALGSFKPIEAHICPLGVHLCPLGLNYAPWGSFMPPGGQVRAPPQGQMHG